MRQERRFSIDTRQGHGVVTSLQETEKTGAHHLARNDSSSMSISVSDFMVQFIKPKSTPRCGFTTLVDTEARDKMREFGHG